MLAAVSAAMISCSTQKMEIVAQETVVRLRQTGLLQFVQFFGQLFNAVFRCDENPSPCQ